MQDSDKLEIIDANSCVQVFLKKPQQWKYENEKTYTKEDCARIAKLFESITNTQISVTSRLSILKKISEQYPEFKVNMCAQAMIRDVVLFYTLDKSEVIERVAKELPVICDAADFIVKTTRQELVKTTTAERAGTSAGTSATEEREENDLSYESSTSSDDDNNQSIRVSTSNRPRITLESLENAVRNASQSSNSLANIAQRQQEGDADGSGTSGRNSSILPNALSSAITQAMGSMVNPQSSTEPSRAENSSVENMETSPVDNGGNFTDLPGMYRTHMYAEQMQTMRHMGLTNDPLNLNVLMMTNGGLENAINLVLAMSDSPQP